MRILKRLLGFISLFSTLAILAIPFFVIFILFGIDRANYLMSRANRIQLNLFSDGDKMGDILCRLHKEMLNESK